MTKPRTFATTMALMIVALGPAFGQAPTSRPAGGDWPMAGGGPHRNAVSAERNIPQQWDIKTRENIKWVAPLGTTTYGSPVVAGGKVYVSTNNGGEYRPHSKGDKGCVLCFDEQTGKLLWQATHDRHPAGDEYFYPDQGIASKPYVDGERLYYVSNRCELVCADSSGFYDGENDGPFTSEKHTDKQDADFVWILDMFAELDVRPNALPASSPVGAGDLIFVCTGNAATQSGKVASPSAPSFIAVNKETGKVVWKRRDPGKNIMHGQWSSPAYGLIRGPDTGATRRPQVIFGGGDGWCYAFDAPTGRLIWKFDLNPKDSVWEPGGAGTKGFVVSMPVIHGNKVFLAIGNDPEGSDGPGHLYAIDATKTGDITETGKIWHVGGAGFGRTVSNVAIADGLLYAIELAGFISCIDVETGRLHWRHDIMAGVWGSPLVVDGKVIFANTDGEICILQHGKMLKELATIDMRHPIFTTPVAANGVLYVATQRFLYAIQKPPATTSAPASAPASGRAPADQWPTFRGNPQLTGVSESTLPEELYLRWKYETPEPICSTAAIVAGVVYVGSDEGALYAINLSDGQLKWKHETREPIESSPAAVDGLVIYGDEGGVLHACEAQSGAERWTFRTEGRIISSANYCVAGAPGTEPDGRIVFGSYDGALYCLRVADGTRIWKYETEERVHATPAFAGTHVLVGGCDAHLHVVNLGDGTPVRRIPLDSVTGASAAVHGSRVFLGTYGQQILGIDWQIGRVVWRFEDPDRSFPYLSSAAVADDLVIIGGRDKRLRAIDSETGKQRWQFLTKGRIDGSPVVVGQRVFIGSGDGTLYAVKLSTGEELWRYETGSAISASPAVAEGCLVIATEDGLICCFGSK